MEISICFMLEFSFISQFDHIKMLAGAGYVNISSDRLKFLLAIENGPFLGLREKLAKITTCIGPKTIQRDSKSGLVFWRGT